MSKASDYKQTAAAYAARPRLNTAAFVLDDGRLETRSTVYSPEGALALAAWIIDTFGETDESPTNKD